MARYQLTIDIEIADELADGQAIERIIKQARDQAGLKLLETVLHDREEQFLKEHRLKKKDRRLKQFFTTLGPLMLARWRSVGKQARYPIDEILGASGKHGISTALDQAMESHCAQHPFGQAAAIIMTAYGVVVSAMKAWRRVQAAGAKLRAQRKVSQELSLPVLPADVADPCEILAIDPDATYVRSRGKDNKSHEVKMAVLYRGRSPVAKSQGKLRYELTEKQAVVAGVDQTADTLFQQVTQKALSYGLHTQTQVISHADGDPCFKRLKRDFIPQTLERLDPWHVFKKIREATDVEIIPKRWIRSFYVNPSRLIKQIESFGKQFVEQRDKERIESLLTYLRNNQAGMEPSGVPSDIKAKHPRMYLRGSGTIESNIDVYVGQRCKRKRMSWSESGLNNILAVREKYLNEQSDFKPSPIQSKALMDEMKLVREFVREAIGTKDAHYELRRGR